MDIIFFYDLLQQIGSLAVDCVRHFTVIFFVKRTPAVEIAVKYRLFHAKPDKSSTLITWFYNMIPIIICPSPQRLNGKGCYPAAVALLVKPVIHGEIFSRNFNSHIRADQLTL